MNSRFGMSFSPFIQLPKKAFIEAFILAGRQSLIQPSIHSFIQALRHKDMKRDEARDWGKGGQYRTR
jgi:hypothetical protein